MVKLAMRSLGALGLVSLAAGAVLQLQDQAAPDAWTLDVVRVLYITAGSSFSFEDFHVVKADTKEVLPHTAVSMGIIPWTNFKDLVKSTQFCNTDGDVLLADHESKKDVRMIRLDKSELSTTVDKEAAYGLFIANCGEIAGLKIQGTVAIQGSTGGYIPGHQQLMLPICAFMTLCFFSLCMYWLFQVLQYSDRVGDLHRTIGTFASVALLHILTWCIHFAVVAQTGNDTIVLMLSSAFAVTTVSLTLQTLFQSAASVVGDSLSCCKQLVIVISALGVVPRVCAGTDRAEYLISTGITVALTAVAALTIGCGLCFAIRDLSTAMVRARETKQEASLKSLQQTCVVMIFLILIFALTAVLELFDRPDLPQAWWKYHAIVVTAPNQFGLLLSLAYLMYVWDPATSEAALSKVSQNDEEVEDLVEEKGGGPQADKIGMSPAE